MFCRAKADEIIELVLELDRKSDGTLGQMSMQIRKKRFEGYNQTWLLACNEGMGNNGGGGGGGGGGGPGGYGPGGRGMNNGGVGEGGFDWGNNDDDDDDEEDDEDDDGPTMRGSGRSSSSAAVGSMEWRMKMQQLEREQQSAPRGGTHGEQWDVGGGMSDDGVGPRPRGGGSGSDPYWP